MTSDVTSYPRSAQAHGSDTAPAGAFLHLVGCIDQVELKPEAVLARALKGDYVYRCAGPIAEKAIEVCWFVGVVSLLIASEVLLYPVWESWDRRYLWEGSTFFRTFGVGLGWIPGAIAAFFVAEGANSVSPRVFGGGQEIAAQLRTLGRLRLSPGLVKLIAQCRADSGLVDRLNTPEGRALQSPLDRLAECRWDLLAVVVKPASTLPDTTLEAFDTAAVPLMAFALTLDEVSTKATESRQEAIARLDSQVDALVAKIDNLVEEHARRRAAARREEQAGIAAVAEEVANLQEEHARRRAADDLEAQAALTAVEEEAIAQMTDLTARGFEAGMSELDALIETDQELDG